MSDPLYTELWELRQLHEQAEKLARKAQGEAHGKFSSDVDEALDATWRALRPRSDMVALEVTEHITLFLRSFFGQNHEIQWVGDGKGLTDVEKSDIIIESVFAKRNRDQDLQKPTVIVRPGPTNDSRMFVGDLKHYDWRTGAETYTGLEPGTIQITVAATLPATAQILASVIKNALRTHRKEIRHRVLHEIDNITTGGYEEGNPFYNRVTNKQTHAVVPITFTYYYQWTSRKGPRPGVYETAHTLVAGIRRKEGIHSPADVDERVESEVKLTGDEILYGVPADE